MYELDQPQRERLRRLNGNDATAARAPESAVGKRTLAEGWTAPAPATPEPDAFAAAAAAARRQLEVLHAANAAADPHASCETAHRVQVAIDRARAAGSAAEIAELEAAAAPVLADAFTPSRAALDEGMTGGRAVWDREVVAWRAAALAYHPVGDVDDEPTKAPVHAVDTAGGMWASAGVSDRFYAALDARDGGALLAAVRDMSREGRGGVDERVVAAASAFLSARQLLQLADLTGLPLAKTVVAACETAPPISRAQLRAYLADVTVRDLAVAFADGTVVRALRARFPGSPTDLIPQLTDAGGMRCAPLLRWYLEETPPKVVAREMLSVPYTQVADRAEDLSVVGPRAWAWLAAVDAPMAARARPGTIAAYEEHAQMFATYAHTEANDVAGYEHAAHQLHQLPQKSARAEVARAQELARLLDKPGVKPSDVRELALTWSDAGDTHLDRATIAKLRTRFPNVTAEELFGRIPWQLVQEAATTRELAGWLLAGAEPEAILRLVTLVPDQIAPWCAMLDSTGTGYAWAHQLGGRFDDHLLRRFVLQCPDKATVAYLQSRVLGDVDLSTGATVTRAAASPAAYGSPLAHLDADLGAVTSPSTEIAADLAQMSPAELDAIRRDAKRMRKVLASMDKDTLPRILDSLQPSLLAVVTSIHEKKLAPGDLIAWIQTRPAAEIVAALGNNLAASELKDEVAPLAPLEAFPQLAAPNTLRAVLQHDPDFIDWLLDSEPTRVMRALVEPAVIGLGLKLLASRADAVGKHWPASADGTPEHGLLVQLAARATGELRTVLHAKLAVPEDASIADANVASLRSSEPFDVTLASLVEDTDATTLPTLLQLCRSHPDGWSKIAEKAPLVRALHARSGLAPTLVFPTVPLAAILKSVPGAAWSLATESPVRILMSPPTAELALALDTMTDDADTFFTRAPRGRALPVEARSPLRQLARGVRVSTAFRLFRTRFDLVIDANHPFLANDLQRMWSVLERLPDAQVLQHAVATLTRTEGTPSDGAEGVYDPNSQALDLRANLEQLEASSPMYDLHQTLTRGEAIDAVGSAREVDQLVAAGKMVRNEDGTYSFVRQEHDVFTHTALHELGHSLDWLLGSKTALIYELAGWKRFMSRDFAGWAADLGGWDAVAPADRAEIETVWISWLRSGAHDVVADMVIAGHPAAASRYEHVGVVQLATQRPTVQTPLPIAGRMAMSHHHSQAWMTLSPRGFHAAPSHYALTSPDEYFAECYASYYVGYDGTPATAANKGGGLVPWIKQWFDEHVDKVQYAPAHVATGSNK